jgi:nucleotide-binding universal stress UspA family protein
MKVLIAYDGSVCSDSAIVDLRRAGLPAVAEALVLSVAEIFSWVEAVPAGALGVGPDIFAAEAMEDKESGTHELDEARVIALRGAERLRADFPRWQITTEAWVDAAGPAIIRKAHAWKPDLIVVGSHGRSGLSRVALGSVSLQVLHHVNTSVRISRHHLHSQEQPVRLLLAIDGSKTGGEVLEEVVARNWPAGAECRVIGVIDSRIAVAAATTLEGTIPVAIEDESRKRLSKAVREAAEELVRAGLRATHQVLAGKPDEVLLAEAAKWSADCIFVGSRKLSAVGRFLLGGVSTPIASQALCSVEVVKQPEE